MAMEDRTITPTALDSAYIDGRNDAADSITNSCRHTIPGLVCTPCVRAAVIARGDNYDDTPHWKEPA